MTISQQLRDIGIGLLPSDCPQATRIMRLDWEVERMERALDNVVLTAQQEALALAAGCTNVVPLPTRRPVPVRMSYENPNGAA